MILFVAMTASALATTVTLIVMPVSMDSGGTWAFFRPRKRIAVTKHSGNGPVVRADAPTLTKGGSTSWT